ncbi:MAG: nucleoside 2-deoxyribosyltransferase domain-containing protein [Methanobrevibacter sp.]|nr:nucleoside 2-deoxyribosyltransferase domain-containing protein [Methanobrevibacter sp.]
MKVFLGGTCNGSQWREELIPELKIDYFNPVIDDWNEEAQKNEIRERQISDYCLYVITPLLTGVYSIAEVVDDSNKRPEKTILCILDEDSGEKWSNPQRKSLEAVSKLVKSNGAKAFNSLEELAEFLNNNE